MHPRANARVVRDGFRINQVITAGKRSPDPLIRIAVSKKGRVSLVKNHLVAVHHRRIEVSSFGDDPIRPCFH